MNLISGLTDNPTQTATLVLADGSRASLNLYFRPNQVGWFYDLALGTFAVNGRRLVSSPNLLRQFRELIPFGIAVAGVANADPLRQEDLVDGTVSLYLLDGADVADVEAALYPGN